jgi:hypothetical protein
MPISIATIQEAANRKRRFAVESIFEAKASNMATAFLCHSHKDKALVEGIINLLNENDWKVYVDWTDSSMPETPDRQTALNIQSKIKDLKYFLYLATENSMSSRWCPWEIGYANGVKNIENILIIPTTDHLGTARGNEYLQLYRRVDFAKKGGLAVWQPGQSNGVWVKEL